MAIETSTSISVNSTSNLNQNSSSVSSKTTSDSSFKDEMDKVSSTDKTKETSKDKETAKSDEKNNAQNDQNKKLESVKVDNKEKDKGIIDKQVQGEFSINGLQPLSYNNVNQMLVDDIQEMADVHAQFTNWFCSSGNEKFSLKMTETDANFFIELANNDNINVQNINAQAQNMLNSGVDVREVQQGYQVSQALLTALSESRQNNQPIRIDFDQNIAVILKVNQNGSLSANFIPGDKVVEQYLRNNIDLLRNAFDEKNLPYTDLSYSNSSKEQNKRRRNEQQGE